MPISKIHLHKLKLIVFFLASVFLFSIFSPSCKTRSKKKDAVKQTLNTDSILTAFRSKQFEFETLDAKVNMAATIDNKKQSFNASLRMKKDSLIWLSVSPFLGIEIARILITTDSVKVLNRLDNTYMLSDIEYLKTLLKADIDFFMLQAVIIGNDFPHFENTNFIINKLQNAFSLENKNRKKIVSESNTQTIIINQIINIDELSYKILKNYFVNNEQNYTFEALYSDFKTIGNQLFGFKTEGKINKENNAWEFNIDFLRININQDLAYPFSIPEKYTKIP